jgi:hypothetical protein
VPDLSSCAYCSTPSRSSASLLGRSAHPILRAFSRSRYADRGGGGDDFRLVKSCALRRTCTRRHHGFHAGVLPEYLHAAVDAGAQAVMIFLTLGQCSRTRPAVLAHYSLLVPMLAGLTHARDRSSAHPSHEAAARAGIVATPAPTRWGRWQTTWARPPSRRGARHYRGSWIFIEAEMLPKSARSASFGPGPGRAFNLGHGVSSTFRPRSRTRRGGCRPSGPSALRRVKKSIFWQ